MAREKKKKAKSEEAEIEKKVKERCRKYPDEVLRHLLATSFFPKELAMDEMYERFDDDTRQGRIMVRCTNDSDIWIGTHPDPKEQNAFHRFRFYTRGESGYTHTALKILAVAIALDNAIWPQDRTEK